jgi:hypothetical protein
MDREKGDFSLRKFFSRVCEKLANVFMNLSIIIEYGSIEAYEKHLDIFCRQMEETLYFGEED